MDDITPSLPTTQSSAIDELTRYLSTPPERITRKEVLLWWHDHRSTYPILSRMALDYLTIPGMYMRTRSFYIAKLFYLATSVDVERVFSKGRLNLTYLRNRMSVQTFRALMCLDEWLKNNFITEKAMRAILKGEPEVDEETEEDVCEGWDKITRGKK